MNNHRKVILDKFYEWVNSNSDWLPNDVTDMLMEILNMEEEIDFWKIYIKKLVADKSCSIIKNDNNI